MSRFKDTLDAQNAAMQRSIDLQVQSVGMSDKEIQRAQQLQQIQERGIDQLNRIEEQRSQALAQAGPGADT